MTVTDMALVRQPAKHLLNLGQKCFWGTLGAAVIAGLIIDRHQLAISLIALSMAIWLLMVGFKIYVWERAGRYRYRATTLIDINDPHLPTYTIFVPVYREAHMLPKLVESIVRLHYPKEKLQVLLLLEEDDALTRQAARTMELPEHFEIIVLKPPRPGEPQTKPRALNVGLLATGEYCVIYDAEDRPEPDQLLKAASEFRHLEDKRVACLQARLRFWNERTNLITRFYWAEYITHFEWTIRGLAYAGLVPPLGGTSNHFLTRAVREVAGWDPFNVTEDADMAAALALHGYRIGMLDSTTYEEATAHLRKADKQRRRWLKGYAQTGLVYTRHPFRTARDMGFLNWFSFNLMMLGTMASLLLNPFFWGMTIVYFATRTTVIERLFPLPLFYMGLTLMLAGNLLLFYQLVVACNKGEGLSSVKYMLLAPLWWAFTSWSAYLALYELIFHTHEWNKTEHGHDLHKEETILVREQIA